MNARGLLLIGLTSLSGCGTAISFVPTNTAPRPMHPRAPQEVAVFSTLPPRPYMEVALLEARQESGYSLDSNEDVIAKLRAAAAQHGCDGLLMTGSADSVVGSSNHGTGSVSTLKGYKASCLVWTTDPAGPPVPVAVQPPPPPPIPHCVPGESRACVGPGGCSGGQACAADGKHYEPCDCGPPK